MIAVEDILNLADLARIELSDDEAEAMVEDIGGILAYVAEVQAAAVSLNDEVDLSGAINALREDSEAHPAGLYTEALLAELPARQGFFAKVKKIL
jgi:aspartyl-tRNA(Asn)/glutamyl-tRNA(Gln) amidotransferase subunit C